MATKLLEAVIFNKSTKIDVQEYINEATVASYHGQYEH